MEHSDDPEWNESIRAQARYVKVHALEVEGKRVFMWMQIYQHADDRYQKRTRSKLCQDFPHLKALFKQNRDEIQRMAREELNNLKAGNPVDEPPSELVLNLSKESHDYPPDACPFCGLTLGDWDHYDYHLRSKHPREARGELIE